MARKKKSKAEVSASATFRPMKDALSALRTKLREQEAQGSEAQESASNEPEPAHAKPSAAPLSSKKLAQREYDDRMALQRAYQGVKPIHVDGQGAPKLPNVAPANVQDAAVSDEAFRPVERMVAEGVRFVVEDVAEGVRAYRASRGKGSLEPLKAGKAQPEASLDLHGFREEPARQMLQRWLRSERERGRRVVRVVHGQGHHSAGSAVIKEAVLDELRKGISAAFVDAFTTAAQKHGGQGATLVALRAR